MELQDFEARRIRAYFSHVIGELGPAPDFTTVCIAHMVPNSVHFLPSVAMMSDLRLVLPKPKSVSRPEFRTITEDLKLPTHGLRRTWSSDPEAVLETFRAFGIEHQDLVLVDIGGYFANSVSAISDGYSGRLLGVMEGTENGVQKYERAESLNVPIVTVARSPLKLPEDYLVASSIVFSVEAVLREVGQILQTRTACVIGYGRVGRSVAAILRGRGISTVVHDTDPVAMAEAAAQGFQCFRRLDNALQTSTLVIGATGNKSLDRFGFASLRSGTVVATVTSADDEIAHEALATYDETYVSENLTRYEESSARYFWLVNGGNAANFIHGAVIGPAIQLIEGEKLAAIAHLATDSGLKPGLQELDRATRTLVARVWNEHFLFD